MADMKTLAAVALLAVFGASTARSWSPEGYPGKLWTMETSDHGNLEGTGTQGRLTQGVQWLTLPGAIAAKTYAAYDWRVRTLNSAYYNAYGPAAGVEFSKSFLDVGADYGWQEYPELNQATQDLSLYASWYESYNWFKHGENPNILGLPIVGLPIATWGKVTHDLNSFEGDGTMGWVSQAVEWVRLPIPTSPLLRTLATYRWRFRGKNRTYFNQEGPAAGLELGWRHLTAGLEYSWRHNPELYTDQRNTRNFQIYLSWFSAWDLKGFKHGK